jgi:Flp pilus assembly protein TadG
MSPPRSHKEGGVVLVTMALVAASVFGCTGLAIDLGRMFVVKNEAQAYCDSAATAAILDLVQLAPLSVGY